MNLIVSWILAILATEAIVEIAVSADVTFEMRALISRLGSFAAKLVTCGYCFSVWASASIAWMLPGDMTNKPGMQYAIVNIVVRTLVLHRMSNLFHGFITIVCHRPPREHVVSMFVDKKDKDQTKGVL